jgi:hypothetical protein
MDFENKKKKHLKPSEKYVFKPTFWLEKLMKLICNKLRNEDHKKINPLSFCKNLLGTYLKPKAHSEN